MLLHYYTVTLLYCYTTILLLYYYYTVILLYTGILLLYALLYSYYTIVTYNLANFSTERPVMFYQGTCFYDGENKPFPDPCPYTWKLATDIFVAPIVDNSTMRNVTFPDDEATIWVNWYDNSEYKGYADII